MKIKQILIVFFALIVLLSCKPSSYTYVGAKDANYIPYYLEVDIAKKLYDKQEYQKSFNKLDSLFNFYEPKQSLFVNELDIYCELAHKFKKKSKLKKVIGILITEYGYNIAKDTSKLITEITKLSGISEKRLEKKFKVYQRNLKPSLIDSLSEMLTFDQIYRKEKNITKIDSIDKVNTNKLRKIFKTYSFPTHKLTGGLNVGEKYNPATFSILLKHISLQSFNEFEPFLLEQVKQGKCPPIIYAGMIDHKISIDQEVVPFIYLGTYRNIPPKDKIQTNNARIKLGIAPLE